MQIRILSHSPTNTRAVGLSPEKEQARSLLRVKEHFFPITHVKSPSLHYGATQICACQMAGMRNPVMGFQI